jgi:anion-transporting  ArsA/GET3 family ATPase
MLFFAGKGGVGLVRDRRVARAARLVEAARAMTELATVGIHTGLVVANLVLPPEQCTTAYTRARRAMQEKYLAEMDERFTAPILSAAVVARGQGS